MAASEPIDPRVRLAISQWPDDAPRGAVSTFCAEHGISRKSFTSCASARRPDGPAAVLDSALSSMPRNYLLKLTDEVKQAIQVRAALEASGENDGTDQRARQDARDGSVLGALHCVAGTDLPRGRRRAP